MDKIEVLQRIIDRLAQTLKEHHDASRDAFSGATDDQVKSESKYDTRGLEASYLARGHALQFEALAADLHALRAFQPRAFKPTDPIGLGALVAVETPGDTFAYFVLPNSGGTEVPARWRDREIDVTVITPDSPVARHLINKKEGDQTSMGNASMTIRQVF